MRYKSNPNNDYTVYAVAGTNNVSFAIDSAKADTEGLLGFSIKRTDPGGGTRFVNGLKVFLKDAKKYKAGTPVSTEVEPIQSLVWDDFTLDPGKQYTYVFIPVKGKPGGLIPQKQITIKIKTEPAFSDNTHDIFFNRGAASSQAYAREFDNKKPSALKGKKQQEAYSWLTRDLEPALLKFIGQAKKGETLLGCFYEFQYAEILTAFKKAIDKGVKVKLIVDMKQNQHTVKGKEMPADPREKNIEALKKAGIHKANIIYREANKNKIQHNKFIVYLKGPRSTPAAVWTGSTNITESGLFGQTNVGHWVKDNGLAKKYQAYWNLLSKDPGAKDGESAADKKKENAGYVSAVMAIQGDLSGAIPKGTTPIYSPRKSLDMLERYFSLIDKAKNVSTITLAFGIAKDLKDLLEKHSEKSPITFMMLEKEDKATKKNVSTFVKLNAKNNVYEAFGAYIKDPVYEWVSETNAKIWKVANFITYIHSKFLIQDPLGDDPIVVTGSANFSANSTNANDENMIVIRGDLRTADIYFTEFNRIFNHYYYRSVMEELKRSDVENDKKRYFLDDTDKWLDNYKKGSLRSKRVEMYVRMTGAKVLP